MSFKSFTLKACVLCSMALAAVGVQADTIRIGTEPTYAPFEFMDNAKRTYEGFDMDIIREAVTRTGHTPEIVSMGFDTLGPSLRAHVIDIIAAAMTITAKRARMVNFTEPYYTAGQGLLVHEADRDRYTDLDSLKGKTIAVQIGTTGAMLAEGVEGATVKHFNTTSDAIMELRNKGADVVMLDKPVLGYFTVVNPRAAKGLVVQPTVLEAEEFGFAVNKRNVILLGQLNKALAEMRADGTYDRIYAKWFGESERR